MTTGLGLTGLDPSLPLGRQQGDPVVPGTSRPPLMSLPPPSSSQPPLPLPDPKIMKVAKVHRQNLKALWPLALATPSPSLSPLSALPPSLGVGSSHISPEFIESWTPMPGLPPVLLAPLNPLPSLVTLLQVKDVLATSEMV
jgi:hypothetical protein